MKTLSVLLLTVLSFGCGGYQSHNGMLPPSTPNIMSITPATANAGSGAFELAVNGTGFATNSVVYWNSAVTTTTFMSGGELHANISAPDIASTGMVTVYVKNPGTGIYAMGINSNMVTFTIH